MTAQFYSIAIEEYEYCVYSIELAHYCDLSWQTCGGIQSFELQAQIMECKTAQRLNRTFYSVQLTLYCVRSYVFLVLVHPLRFSRCAPCTVVLSLVGSKMQISRSLTLTFSAKIFALKGALEKSLNTGKEILCNCISHTTHARTIYAGGRWWWVMGPVGRCSMAGRLTVYSPNIVGFNVRLVCLAIVQRLPAEFRCGSPLECA